MSPIKIVPLTIFKPASVPLVPQDTTLTGISN